MWELVSWYDGKKLYKNPEVAGRWSFMKGEIMCIIHNRTDPKNHTSMIAWGKGSVSNGEFKYAYTEFLNLEGSEKNTVRDHSLPWGGMRKFKVEIKGDGVIMKTQSGKQTWEITKENMIYTDTESGKDKIFAQRKWKRIAP